MTLEAARPADGDDVPRLVELAAQALGEARVQRGGELWALREARPTSDASAFAALLGDPDRLVLAGTFCDVVVGFAVVGLEPLRDGGTLGVLSDLYVEPAARDVGVGEALMDAVLAWCTAHGCRGLDSLALPGDRVTKNFFERYGLTARGIVVHRRLDGGARP